MTYPLEFHVQVGVLITVGLASSGFSWAVGHATWRTLQKWQVLDTPNQRSSHSAPIPRGGGLGIMAVILIGAAALSWWTESGMSWLVISMTIMLAGVSFLDDRRPLPWWLRLGFQLVAATAVVVYLLNESPLENIWLACLLVALLAGYANAVNFMDGINGLVAAQTAVSGVGLATIALLGGISPMHPAVVGSVLLAGAAAGFLPHNFPRARMFMGDVGSVPLGFLLMLLTVWLARVGGGWLWLPLGALHAGFILDTSLTMARRALRRETLHHAHREHFYQRLIRADWTHKRVTTVETMLQVAVVVAAISAVGRGWAAAVTAAGFSIVLWLVFFAVVELIFRRHTH